MKKIYVFPINESSNLTPKEKMRLFELGQRNLNIKACGDEKLLSYFKICVQNKFEISKLKILQELFARKILAHKEIYLENISFSEYDFDKSFAEEILCYADNTIWELFRVNNLVDADCNPIDMSDFLMTELIKNIIECLIWAIVLQIEKDKVDKLMELCVSIPTVPISKAQLKSCIKKIVADQKIMSKINNIIDELQNKNNNINEDLERHEQLNPNFWNVDKTLKEEVKQKILEIADRFLDKLKEDEINIDVKDIKIVGSNCSYNYTKDSDLDIHIVANTADLEDKDKLYPVIYDAYRALFNAKYEIRFYDTPVELYVETSDTILEEARKKSALKSAGVYSVLHDSWIKEPVLETIPEIDEDKVKEELGIWINKVDEVIAAKDITRIEEFLDELYVVRQSSIASDGEFGIGNLVFKELRNKKYLDQLKDLKNELISIELSLQ